MKRAFLGVLFFHIGDNSQPNGRVPDITSNQTDSGIRIISDLLPYNVAKHSSQPL